MALQAGMRLGSHEILEPIGAGGMGEVYRARDTKLGREVAIKVLPEAFAQDANRLSRFEREAKLLASLNHPSIAAIYGFEESEDTRFIVLELVEGETLAERLARGPMDVQQAVELALQIVAALEAAHEQGVIHRDLKPANIKITPDGKIKVLDFGLAKAFASEDSDASRSNSPTLSRAATLEGVILGTAAYMSPEQAKGVPVDKRSDLFSFGCVLFEMLTGRRAFQGELAPEVLASVINREPDEKALPANLHPRVRELLERCFEKDPEKRWQAAGDIRVELERALASPDETRVHAVAAAPRAKLWRVLPWVVAILAGVSGWILKPPEPGPVSRFRYELPADQQYLYTGRRLVDVSRDGSQFVYVASEQLHLRSMDAIEARPVPGAGRSSIPTFSPDGAWVAYYSPPDRQLRKIPTSGGAPVTLADAAEPFGMSWGVDDTVIFAQAEGILRVSGNGGVPEVIVPAEDDERFHSPQILPGGEAVLFTRTPRVATRWNETEIVVQTLDSDERKILWSGGGDARYVPTGHLVYVLQDDLFALPFDVGSLEVMAGPVPVTEGAGLIEAQFSASASYAFSASGSLVYVVGAGTSSDQRVLALVDRDGFVAPLNVPPAPYVSPRLSPDGRKLAVQTRSAEGSLVWVYDLAGDEAIQQLTFEGNNERPIWTPDGRHITFASDRDGAGTMNLYLQPADGSGVAERLTTAEEGTSHWPWSWSPDGRNLSFGVVRGSDWDAWILARDAESSPESLYAVPGKVHHAPEFSPDGKWMAYGTGDTAPTQDIYVEPFPPTGARWRISQNGGTHPLWSPDGSELFYRRARGPATRLQSVRVTTAPEFAAGSEQTLPVEGFLVFGTYRDYDITPDGKRFAVVFPATQAEAGESPRHRIDIVLNWFEHLKERVPR